MRNMYSLFGAIGGHDWTLVLNLSDFCLSKGQGTGIVGVLSSSSLPFGSCWSLWCFLLLFGKGYITKPIFRGETVFYLKCDMLYILIRSLVNALYDFIRMDKKEMILATQEFQVLQK